MELETLQLGHICNATSKGDDALQESQAVLAQSGILGHDEHFIEEAVNLRDHGQEGGEETIG
jgi:hypothetical protein